MAGESLHVSGRGPQRSLCETVKVKLGLHWRAKVLEMSDPWGIPL